MSLPHDYCRNKCIAMHHGFVLQYSLRDTELKIHLSSLPRRPPHLLQEAVEAGPWEDLWKMMSLSTERSLCHSLPWETDALGKPALSHFSAHASPADQPWNMTGDEGHLMVCERLSERGEGECVGQQVFLFWKFRTALWMWIICGMVQLERKQLCACLLLGSYVIFFFSGIYEVVEWHCRNCTAVFCHIFLPFSLS